MANFTEIKSALNANNFENKNALMHLRCSPIDEKIKKVAFSSFLANRANEIFLKGCFKLLQHLKNTVFRFSHVFVNDILKAELNATLF